MFKIRPAQLCIVAYIACLAPKAEAAVQPWVPTLKHAESNFSSNELPSARHDYETALAQVKNSKIYLPSVEFAILRRLGEIAGLQMDLELSREYFEQALKLAVDENLATKEDLSILATRLACVQFELQKNDRAQRTFEDWLPVRSTLRADIYYVNALGLTACFLIADGKDRPKAIKYCDMAYHAIIETGRSYPQYDFLLNHIGIFYCQALEFRKATMALSPVRPENVGEQCAALTGQLCLIQSYLQLGNKESSEKTILNLFNKPALLERPRGKVPQTLVERELNMAIVLSATGHKEKVLELFERWLPIATSTSDQYVIESKLHLANIMAEKGNLERASQIISECEAAARALNKASTLNSLANAHFQLAHYDKAIALLNQAKALYTSQKPKEMDEAIIQIEEIIAISFERKNKWQESYEACRIATQHIQKSNYPLSKVYPEFKYWAGKRELEKGDKELGRLMIKSLIAQSGALKIPRETVRAYSQLLTKYESTKQ